MENNNLNNNDLNNSEDENKGGYFHDEGVEFLKDLGISEVSNRTFIHEEELARFLNGDFKNINKAKAMGFIQILQREYRIDLNNLKNRYLEYMKEHEAFKEEPKESIMMEEVRSEARARKITTILFLFLFVGVIAYLVNKYNLLNFNSMDYIDTVKMPKIEKIEEDNLLQKQTTSEKNEKKENTDNKNVIELNKVLESNKKQEEVTKVAQNDIQSEQSDTNINTETKTNTDSQNELDLSQLNSDLAKNDNSEENADLYTVEEDTNSSSNNDNAVVNELYIIPKSKVWIGTIDLDTLKKQDFLSKPNKRVDIDTTSNKLIMIGHRYIKIYFNGELVKFKRKGPIRFKYIDGKLTEINRKEFNKLAKGRQW